MATFHPDNLIESIKRDSLRVKRPSKVVFLCGGKLGDPQAQPLVLRDAYYRLVTDSPPDYKVMLAEDANPLTADALYEDLLSFQSDVAQVVGLIVLSVESAGSLAEFGAFAALETVAPRLLAIVNDHYYDKTSFIRDGPIRFLESKYGDEWVLSLETTYLGISEGDEPLKTLDIIRLHDSVAPVISQRLDAQPATEKFVKEKDGHIILMITGLCQLYGALNQKEIRRYVELLGNMSIDQKRLYNFLYCAELLGWIRKVKKGNNTYYVATGGEQALDFSFEDNVEQRDKLRWRSDIRAFWKTKREDEDIEITSRILFRRAKGEQLLKLSIGAPSSPCLSNVLMYNFDEIVSREAFNRAIAYTRYADDLTFSGQRIGMLRDMIHVVEKATSEISHPKLRVNKDKTTFVTAKFRRTVTGVILTNDGLLSLGRDRKRTLSAQVHRASLNQLDADELQELAGYLAFANVIEPTFLRRLERRYGADVIRAVQRAVKVPDTMTPGEDRD